MSILDRPLARAAILIAVAALACLSLVWPAQAQSTGGEDPPAWLAEQVRAELVQAQLALGRDPDQAKQHVQAARERYQQLLARAGRELPTALGDQMKDGFSGADMALQSGNAVGMAESRAAIWTALLSTGQALVEAAITRGDASAAQGWLAVREYRRATRFARPSADATLALAEFAAGQRAPADTIQAARADLLDTYQARLDESLAAALAADSRQYPARRAETAALAEGYFLILLPELRELRGEDAAAETRQVFAELRAAAREGTELGPIVARIQTQLQGFRAAPLTSAEQARRAGQLFRYLSLVPVEYERGVRNGQVAKDFEIVEAITFRNGAAAAFADLRAILDTRGAAEATQAAQAAGQLAQLEQILSAAIERRQVADPAQVRQLTEEVTRQLNAIVPPEWLRRNTAADFDVILASLASMETAVRAGQYDLAESSRLDAYALLETGPEARLSAFAPQYVVPIENLFWQGNEDRLGLAELIRAQATPDDIRATTAALQQLLGEAQTALGQTSTPEATAVNAAVIVMREGMEAVLILASLMGSLKAATQRKFRRPMWAGVVVAAVATVVTWLAAQGALTLLARYGEVLEAVVSVVAVGILLLVMNWFFHDVYWTGWMANFHAQKRRVLTGAAGQMLGLAVLGFTSVYREGFETVLFLQALALESGADVVLLGTAAGLAITLVLGWVTFSLQARLPYKKMLIVTGVLIGLVLVTMVGKTVHAFQVVGWMPISPIRGLMVPHWLSLWFGVFATWQGMVAQASAIIFTVGSYFLAERLRKRTPATPQMQRA